MAVDHFAEGGEGGAVVEPCGGIEAGDLGYMEHPSGEFDGEILRIFGAFPAEDIERFLNLERIADGPSEGLVHIGDEGGNFFTHGGAGVDERTGELAGIFDILHEGAGTTFYIEHKGIDAFGHLFGHDGGDDQRDGGNRGGDIAQGVEFFIGWRDLGGLADHGATAGFQGLEKLGFGESGAIAGDGFELVEGAAGDAETPPGDHRDGGAAGGDERGEGNGYFVADAAGGVFVDFGAGNAGGVDDFSGVHHREGEVGGFAGIHAVEVDGHGESGHLIVRDRTVGVSRDEGLDLLGVEFFAIAFLFNNPLWKHGARIGSACGFINRFAV